MAPFDLQPGDYVGLYRNDPQWVGPGSPELTVAASKPGGYHLTEVQFPDITGGNLMYIETERLTGRRDPPWENAILVEGGL